MPLATVRVTNMRLYGIGYDYMLNTIVDISPESLSYPNNCDIYAILVPCESSSSSMLPDSVKTRDSYLMMYEALSYSSSPPQSEEELAEIDQNFGVDHYYENTIQHVTIPVDFPGCWDLILQNKTSLKRVTSMLSPHIVGRVLLGDVCMAQYSAGHQLPLPVQLSSVSLCNERSFISIKGRPALAHHGSDKLLHECVRARAY